jgi:GEVED domain/CARDB
MFRRGNFRSDCRRGSRFYHRARHVGLEELENRYMLAGVPIPGSVNPLLAPQTEFATSESLHTIAMNSAVGGRLMRFSLDVTGYSDEVQFRLDPRVLPGVTDSALALYDDSGNLITSADLDPQPNSESLTAEIVSGRVYVLGAFFNPSGPGMDFQLHVTPGMQVTNPTIALDPATGTAQFLAITDENPFQTATDVDYYRLDMMNAAGMGTLSITPNGPGVEVHGTLYRRLNDTLPWVPHDVEESTGGGVAQFTMTSEVDRALTDYEFLLAVAPKGFASTPGSYQIQVQSTAVLGPAAVGPSPALDGDFLTPAPKSIGIAEETKSGTFALNDGGVYRFGSTEAGEAEIRVETSVAGTIHIYDESGTTLLAAVTTVAGTEKSVTLATQANTKYLARVAGLNGLAGSFDLSVAQSYTPQLLNVSMGNATVQSINLGSDITAQYRRVQTANGQNVLLVQVDAQQNESFRVVVVGAGLPLAEASAAAGEPLVFPIDISKAVGPFDVYVQGTSGPTTAMLTVGAVDIPRTIPLTAVPAAALGTDGDFSVSRATSGFGTMTGVRFVEFQRESTGLGTVIEAQGPGGARSPGTPVTLLAHYREISGQLTLDRFAIADATNLAKIQFSDNLIANVHHAIVGFNLTPDSSGSIAYSLNGEAPMYVGVKMVPDQDAPLPPPHRAILSIRNVTLKSELDRDLWKTILPYNFLNSSTLPVVKFDPADSSMQVRLTVTLDPMNPSATLATQVMTETTNQLTLNANVNLLKGATVYFIVEPIAGKLADGIYTLEMRVNTTDPFPYLVEEPAWRFFGTNPTGTPMGIVTLPNEPVVDIVQNQLGDGSSVSSFTSSAPFTAGSIDVFRFAALTPGPVSVRTVGLLDGFSDSINTNLRLYKEVPGANGVTYLKLVEELGDTHSDWFPADRSTLDDQTHVNFFDQIEHSNSGFYLTGGGEYYVVVKSEEGTLGDYRIEVDAQPFPLLGQGSTYSAARTANVIYLPVTGTTSQASFSVPYVQGVTRFVGHFPIQVPEFHNGTLQVVGQPNSVWNLDLFDRLGNELPGNVILTGSPTRTEGTFTVPAGSQTVYLRVHERVPNPASFSTINVSMGLVPQFGITAPPAVEPATDEYQLATSPWSASPVVNGVVVPYASAFAPGVTYREYSFQAPAGELDVTVIPQRNSQGVADVELVWGIYVNGTLRGWNHTLNTADVGGSDMSMSLPKLRQPLDATDLEFDVNTYYDVVVYAAPLSSPNNGGDFTITVGHETELPMRNAGDLVLPPLSLSPSRTKNVDGNDWVRFLVPYGTTNLALDIDPVGGTFGGSVRYAYSVYDTDGNRVLASTISSSVIDPGVTVSLTSLNAGRAYYLRAGMERDAREPVVIRLSATLSKNGPGDGHAKPPLQDDLDNFYGVARVRPDGTFNTTIIPFLNPSEPIHGVFWTSQSGPISILAHLGTSNDHSLALYAIVKDCAEFCAYREQLVDFSNGSSLIGGLYALNTFVEPGAYAVRAYRAGEIGIVNYALQTPKVTTEEVILEPNTGANDYLAMRGVRQARNGFGAAAEPLHPIYGFAIPDGLRTSHYRVMAPPGALGDVTAAIENLDAASLGRTSAVLHRLTGSSIAQILAVDSAAPELAFADYHFVNPGEEYFLSVYQDEVSLFNNPASRVAASFRFLVPESGKPDLVIEPVTLSPNHGETLVGVRIQNVGFGSASVTHSQFRFSDTTQSPVHFTESVILENALGPRSGRNRILPWVPQAPADEVSYEADFDELLVELKENNNFSEEILSSVDAHAPVVTINVSNAALNRGGNKLGRVIAKVSGVTSDVTITTTDADGPSHLFETTGRVPVENQTNPHSLGEIFYMGAVPSFTFQDFDFGTLLPTDVGNPNNFRIMARDIYGLPSQVAVKTVDVMQYPGWLLPNDGTALSFDAATSQYDIHFRNSLVDVGPTTLDELLGASIPFVGGLENRLLVQIGADSVATLDPADPVVADIFAKVQVTILGVDIVDETFTPENIEITDYISVGGNLVINSTTLDSDFLAITFRMEDLPLFDIQSPEIPLFAYGVPGVASINANLQFSLVATLDAAVTVAIDIDPTAPLGLPSRIGLASPSFIAPTVDVGLSIAGEVEILGFDLAEIAGTIHLAITPAYGLETPPTQFVEFADFFDHDCFQVTGELYGEISAELLGIEIFSFDLPTVQLPIPNSCQVVTSGLRQNLDGTTIIPGGDDLMGKILYNAQPQLVIDPATGDALYMQLIDVDPHPLITRQNMAYSRRQNGVWSPLATISDPTAHVSTPVLTRVPSGNGAASVVVYQTLTSPSDPAQLTRNQFLTGQELRYRYFDGTSWGSEQILTANALYDQEHTVAFNSGGKGAVAWVQNGAATPINNQGRFDRASNEIMVATWNTRSLSFNAPTILSNNAVGDAKPDVYSAPNGRVYVVWSQDSGFDSENHVVTANQIMYSVFEGVPGQWTTPAPLPMYGLPTDGKIDSVQVASNGGENIHVLVGHTQPMADKSIRSKLYNRPATTSTFTSPQPVQVVAENMNYAHLRTTNGPSGELVAYWMSGEGQTTDVYGSVLGPASSGPAIWSRVEPLTSTDGNEFPFTPALAVDTDGTYQLVYERRTPPASELPGFPVLLGHPDGDPAFDAPVAGTVVTSSYAPLPDFGFARSFAFEHRSEAPSGRLAKGTAVVMNRGRAGDLVTVEYVNQLGPGSYEVVGSRQIYLAPGATYEVSHDYPTLLGETTYGMRLIAAAGTEMIGLGDNLSVDTITGKLDLGFVSLLTSTPEPQAGDTISIRARIRNHSNISVSNVQIKLWEGNPHWGFETATPVSVQSISFNSDQTRNVDFNYTVPAQGGVIPLYVTVDFDEALNEVTRGNNSQALLLTVLPEIAVGDLTTTVLNYSGVNNVLVRGTIANTGHRQANNVLVELYYRLDDDDFALVNQTTVSSLMPGQSVPVSLAAPGLVGRTGENRYRMLVRFSDDDPTNQLSETLRILQGLPDLTPVNPLLNVENPIQGEPTTLKVEILNLGIATAENVQVDVYGTNFSDGKRFRLGTHTIPEIDPLGSVETVIDLNTWPLLGGVNFCVEVDVPQNVLELTDLNNTVCFDGIVSNALPHDYGDAPENYPVFLADDGARHRHAVGTSGEALLYLGTAPDSELNGQPNVDAQGDESFNVADEGEISFLDPVQPARTTTIEVETKGSVGGYLNGWIDFNHNGSWQDDGEQVFQDVFLLPGVHQIPFTSPDTAIAGTTYARFRFSTAMGLADTGPAPDGEVEDYQLRIDPRPPQVTSVSRNGRLQDRPDLLNALTFQFSSDVIMSLNITDLSIINRVTGQSLEIASLPANSLTWTAGTRTARWNLAPLNVQPGYYSVVLNSSSIFDATGTRLDGDGDFVAGGDFLMDILVAIAGDANLDGNVDGSDFSRWNAHKFTSGQVEWEDGDFNDDNIVDGSDFNIWNTHKFTGLPQPRPSAAPVPTGLLPIPTRHPADHARNPWTASVVDLALQSQAEISGIMPPTRRTETKSMGIPFIVPHARSEVHGPTRRPGRDFALENDHVLFTDLVFGELAEE